MITHVVLFWTEKPYGASRNQLLAAARELVAIPGVLNFRVGQPVSSARAAVDDSFAVAISMDFDNQAALDAYQVHPLHQAFVRDFVKPLAGRFLVYDFQ